MVYVHPIREEGHLPYAYEVVQALMHLGLLGFYWNLIKLSDNIYLATFLTQITLMQAIRCCPIHHKVFTFFVWPWSKGAMSHHLQVRTLLHLYGVPSHAWNVKSIRKIIFGFAKLDQVGPRMLISRDLTIFKVIIFYENLNNIPCFINVTIEDAMCLYIWFLFIMLKLAIHPFLLFI